MFLYNAVLKGYVTPLTLQSDISSVTFTHPPEDNKKRRKNAVLGTKYLKLVWE